MSLFLSKFMVRLILVLIVRKPSCLAPESKSHTNCITFNTCTSTKKPTHLHLFLLLRLFSFYSKWWIYMFFIAVGLALGDDLRQTFNDLLYFGIIYRVISITFTFYKPYCKIYIFENEMLYDKPHVNFCTLYHLYINTI